MPRLQSVTQYRKCNLHPSCHFVFYLPVALLARAKSLPFSLTVT